MKTIKLIALLCLLLSEAHAATYVVNTPLDTIDANTFDQTCADVNGLCSLRAAITTANTLAGPHTIFLARHTTYFLTQTNDVIDDVQFNDLDINSALTISVADPLVPATTLSELPLISATGPNFTDRVFEIDLVFGGDVTFFGLGIEGGSAADSQTQTDLGGGIFVHANVTNFNLLNSYVVGNTAQVGAGIYTLAQNSLISFSDLSNNNNAGGAMTPQGAAIYGAGGQLRIQYSSIHNNVNNSGVNCFSYAVSNAAPSELLVFSSLIANNGFFNLNAVGDPVEQHSGSCVGGVNSTEASASLVNVTLSDNGVFGLAFTDNVLPVNNLLLRNSVLNTDESVNCSLTGSAINLGDANGGFNVADDFTCGLPDISGNQQMVDPMLSPLLPIFSDDASKFLVKHPLEGSPLIDAGSLLPTNVGNPNACHQFDQRLTTRPVNGGISERCDIGAIELNDLIFRNGFEVIN